MGKSYDNLDNWSWMGQVWTIVITGFCWWLLVFGWTNGFGWWGLAIWGIVFVFKLVKAIKDCELNFFEEFLDVVKYTSYFVIKIALIKIFFEMLLIVAFFALFVVKDIVSFVAKWFR